MSSLVKIATWVWRLFFHFVTTYYLQYVGVEKKIVKCYEFWLLINVVLDLNNIELPSPINALCQD